MSLARNTKKMTKWFHKFYEHEFGINCKKLCRYRHTYSKSIVQVKYHLRGVSSCVSNGKEQTLQICVSKPVFIPCN